MIVVLSVRDAVAVIVSAVSAEIVTDTITIAIDKHLVAASASTASTSAVAKIVTDTIAVSVYGSWACADIVT
jgi:uncharacterized protein YaaW (UPF0174 family)